LKCSAHKRSILEQKSQIRRATAAEFQALRVETVRRTQSRTSAGNERAHERNVKMLEAMNVAIHSSSARALLEDQRLLGSAARLASARDIYSRSAADMLPAWTSHRSDMQLQAAAELREQRAGLERRRQRRLLDAEEELRNTMVLEEERRQYLLAVALENRDTDYIRSQSKALLDESRAVDYLMSREVDRHQHQAHTRDARALHEMHERLGAALAAHGTASASADADAGAGADGQVDAYRQVLTTSAEFIAKALRETPLPPPVIAGPADFDLPKRQRQQPQPQVRVSREHDRQDEGGDGSHSQGARARAHQPQPRRRSPGQRDRTDPSAARDRGQDRDGDRDFVANRGSVRVNVSDDSDSGGGIFSGDSGDKDRRHPEDNTDMHSKEASRGGVRTAPRSNRKLAAPQSPFGRPQPSGSPQRRPDSGPAAAQSPEDRARARSVSAAESVHSLEQASTEPLLCEAVTTADKIELLDRLCRRIEALDDVSRERAGAGDASHRLRREDQFLTAIQAYRRAARTVMGYSSSSSSDRDRDRSGETGGETEAGEKFVPEILHELCRDALCGRERGLALHGIEAVAECVVHLAVEVGPFLLPG
jgi:hypothetical protein